MNTGALDLNLLRVFHAIYSSGSVSRAAESLGLSQPATSLALARLRDQFSDPLFVRTRGSMRATPLARQIAGPVGKVLGTISSDVLARTAFDPRNTTKQFVFGMSDVGETVNLPPILKQMRAQAPNARVATITLPPRRMEEALESGEVDLAVGYFPDLTKGNLYRQRLFERGWYCVASSSHPRIRTPLTLRQLLEEHHVQVLSGVRLTDRIEKHLQRKGLRRHIAVQVQHYLCLPAILGNSELVSIVPSAVGKLLGQMPSLKTLELPFDAPMNNVLQYWHARFHADPINKWLRGAVAQVLQE